VTAVVHEFPHVPQLFTSFAMLVHPDAHAVREFEQAPSLASSEPSPGSSGVSSLPSRAMPLSGPPSVGPSPLACSEYWLNPTIALHPHSSSAPGREARSILIRHNLRRVLLVSQAGAPMKRAILMGRSKGGTGAHERIARCVSR